jgi:signal peptidase II
MKQEVLRVVSFYALIIFVALLDQGVKLGIRTFLSLNQSITVIPGVLSFTYVENPGAAFGMLKRMTPLLLLLTLALFYLVYRYRWQIKKQPPVFRCGMAVGLGGALGNFIDRILRGRVIDFLDLDFWPLQNWPVFNLADIAIFLGAVIIFFLLFRDQPLAHSRKGEV